MISDRLRSVFRGAVALAVIVLVLRGEGWTSPLTIVVLAVAVGYVIASTIVEQRALSGATSGTTDAARAFGDVLVLCAVIVAVDHPPGGLLLFLCAIPLGHSLALPAPVIAAVTATALLGALTIWAFGTTVHPDPVTNGDLLITSFGLVWAGLASCLIAVERDRRSTRIGELSGTLQDLITQVITAEETERRRMADLLHDDVFQLLLVTRHDVTDALEGDSDALPRAADGIDLATRHLRRTIGGLRSEGVAARQLGDGLGQIAAQTTERRGCTITVDVAPELEHGDHPMLLTFARDLLREVERRTTAMTIGVRAFTRNRDVVLSIRHDDPRYMGVRLSDAPSDLLAAVDQRARAVGGSFVAHRAPDGGRTFTVVVPLRPSLPFPPPARATGLRALTSPYRPRRRAADPPPTLETRHDVQSR
ncbi:MAG: hypothetical protein WC558_05290 [Patulibacter sp.]